MQKRPRRAALVAAAVIVVAATFGLSAPGKLHAARSFSDPGSQSARAAQLVAKVSGTESSPGIVALVNAPPFSKEVVRAARLIASVKGVVSVQRPLQAKTSLVSNTGNETLVAATLSSNVDPNLVVRRLRTDFYGRRDVMLGGSDVAYEEAGAESRRELAIGELIAFPLLAALSLAIFRGRAAVLPITVGGISLIVSFCVLRAINAIYPLSSLSLNLVIGLGLGLAVDYSLLLMMRFREETRTGDAEDAITRTLGTAGRTVLFSALTVSAAMLSLLVFPQNFLKSMAVGGVCVALTACVTSLLVLPVFVVFYGERLRQLEVRRQYRGRWYRIAQITMRRPALTAIATTAVLIVIAAPALGIRWTTLAATALPKSQSARVVSELLEHNFAASNSNTIVVVARSARHATQAIDEYALSISALPGASHVGMPRYVGGGVWVITLGAGGQATSSNAETVIALLRSMKTSLPVLVGGPVAEGVDQSQAIATHLPLAATLLAIVTLILLWAMTATVLLPIKALLTTILTTLTATGILTLLFQDGNMAKLLDVTTKGGIEQTSFLVFVALTFALSLDYGVIVMSRIVEAHAKGHATRHAIATGIEDSGRIVTAAAILLSAALAAFATSEMTPLKEVGLGTALGVLIDAFAVRMFLVPSLMAVLKDANWWSPSWLRAWHRRLSHMRITKHLVIDWTQETAAPVERPDHPNPRDYRKEEVWAGR
jgi:uncharacterized membrane protein YdfJ with MMPL/SSD domain